MNEKKFCFISCVNNEEYYNETIAYINSLYVPEDYEVEILSIKDAKSIAAGYNEAMKMSDAKYKIYLHQDTFIINKNFLLDIVLTFNKDNTIGMIGAVGCKKLPTSGIWFESETIVGEVYENNTLFKKNSIEGKYEEVEGISGFLMVTQYDILWREDIFDGWHFYDASQVIEFKRNGYKTVIPNQQETWCIHDIETENLKNDFNQSRIKYLYEYSKDIFPLVSILIPTYNRPKYFELALKSVLEQTYNNLEIIIGDDSSNNETEQVIQKYVDEYDNIKYFHNQIRLGQFDNDLKLLEMASSKYINFLMDYDLFESNKIERMMNYFIADDKNEISLVTSNRKLIDGNRNFIGNYILKESIDEIGDIIWEGNILSELFLSQNKNIIGEPTTVLFNKSKLTENFGYYSGRRCICNVDQGTWLNLLSNGKGVIIKEALSSFRKHNDQQLNNQKNIIGGVQDYTHMILNARENGLFESNIEYSKAVKKCYDYAKLIRSKYISNETIMNCLIALKEAYEISKKDIKLVSIILIVNNIGNSLELELQSVINQTYSNIEIIILNDTIQSLENEYDSIKYYQYNSKFSENENINKAIQKSKGDYFIVLKHDFKIDKNTIEEMMKCFIDDVALVLINISGSNKIEYLSSIDGRRYLIYNCDNFINQQCTAIISRKFFNNSYGEYAAKNYNNISDLSTYCSCLKYGSIGLVPFTSKGENKSQRIEDSIIGLIETAIIAFQMKDDRIYTGINEYKLMLDRIFASINEKVCICSSADKNKFLEIAHNIRQQIDIDIDGDFYYLGSSVQIKSGVEFVCKEGIDIGNNVLIQNDSTFMLPYLNYKNGCKITIKDGCDLGRRLFVSSTNNVIIEENVIVASNVHITDHNHEYRNIGIPIKMQGVTSFTNEVIIGAGSWIANGCVIAGNIKIGRGCVIGANSVVLNDIPDYSVAVGSPAKIIKYFDKINGEWVNYCVKEKFEEYNKRLKTQRPLLTIGIITYNRASYLERCLTNIYKQIGNDNLIEVLVCDNCSTDATEKVINKFRSLYSNLNYHRNEINIGATPNLMKVLELSRGEFVNPHGDDDYFIENVIYEVVDLIYKNRHSSVLFTLPSGTNRELVSLSGLNEYINEVSYMCTLISGVYLNKDGFNRIKNKNKYIYTDINQVYLQMELLIQNPKFAVMKGSIFTRDSGEHKPSGYNFAEVFIKNYLDILYEYKGAGVSEKILKKEKFLLLNNMILPWINKILVEDINLELKELIDIYDKYYCDEDYFQEKRREIENLINGGVLS